MRTPILAAALALCAPLAAAAMPEVALTDRHAWPHPIDTRAGFDLASRAEILAAVGPLEAAAASRKDAGSVAAWREGLERRVLENFRAAAAGCTPSAPFCPARIPSSFAELQALAASTKPPPELAAWATEAQAFWTRYMAEQVRLAALFPKTTSEILPLDGSEILGSDFPDRSFALTFDDGPSPANGSTEKVAALLRSRHVNGTFFLLGNNLATRAKPAGNEGIRTLYAGMCVASHGAEHRSHASWDGALPGLAAFHPKLGEVLPEGQPSLALFRPPYGQRTPAVLQALRDGKLRDMLWNIDSQDWQKSVTPALAAGRVTTLMLFWRRGIILFHDIHPKAEGALPAIWRATDGARLVWRDCRAE